MVNVSSVLQGFWVDPVAVYGLVNRYGEAWFAGKLEAAKLSYMFLLTSTGTCWFQIYHWFCFEISHWQLMRWETDPHTDTCVLNIQTMPAHRQYWIQHANVTTRCSKCSIMPSIIQYIIRILFQELGVCGGGWGGGGWWWCSILSK